jgi:hypothetical protein
MSSLDRLLACAGGDVLGGQDVKSKSAVVAAAWGTMVHEWKESGKIVAVPGHENLAPLFEKKLRVTGVQRETYWPADMVHELAVAVNPFTGYAVYEGPDTREAKESWKAAHSDDWCTGTVDGYFWMFDTLAIDDLKTGREVTLEGHQWQVTGYALAVARVLDYRGPVNVMITHWSRYPVDNRPVRLGRTVEPDELLAFEKRLAKLRDDILRAREDKKTLRLYPGDIQCKWCPSRGVCPEWG